MSVKLNRVLIAFVLIYFPIATLGETGSYWRLLQTLALLVAVLAFGFVEGRKFRDGSTAGNAYNVEVAGRPSAVDRQGGERGTSD